MKNNIYRRELVQLLFALALTQIAIFASGWLFIDPLWSWEKFPSAFHLILAFFTILFSWFGWRNSMERAESSSGEKAVWRTMLLTCFDVLLVLLYFQLVRSVDIVEVGLSKVSENPILESPTAYREARVLSAVFFIYTFWDLLEKKGVKWTDLWPASTCFAISVIIALLTRPFDESGSLWSTLFFDCSLLSLIGLFRLFKWLECTRYEKENTTPPKRWAQVVFLLLLLFALLGSLTG